MTRRLGFRQAKATTISKKRGGGVRGGFRHMLFVPRKRVIAVMPMDAWYKDPRPVFQDKGTEQPYYVNARHRKDRGNDKAVWGVCTSGWKDTDDEDEANDLGDGDCVFCYLQGKGDRSIDRRVMANWPVVHLTSYHLVQATDRDDNLLYYKQGPRKGQAIMERQECQGKGCVYCKNEDEMVYGSNRYIELSPNFLKHIQDIDADLSRACSNCRDGEIEPTALLCPECGKSLVDLESVTEEQAANMAVSFMTCKNCGHKGVPIEDVECSNCDDPKPTGFNDVVLFLTKEGEDTGTTIKLKHPKNPSKVGWCYRDDFDVDGDQIAWYEDDDAEELTYDDEIKELMQPFDFANMMGTGATEETESQARRLQVPDPFKSGGHKQDDDDDGDDDNSRSRPRSRGRSRRRPNY